MSGQTLLTFYYDEKTVMFACFLGPLHPGLLAREATCSWCLWCFVDSWRCCGLGVQRPDNGPCVRGEILRCSSWDDKIYTQELNQLSKT